MRPMFIAMKRDPLRGTLSRIARLTNRPSDVYQIQEKVLILTDNTPAPITAATIEKKRFIFHNEW